MKSHQVQKELFYLKKRLLTDIAIEDHVEEIVGSKWFLESKKKHGGVIEYLSPWGTGTKFKIDTNSGLFYEEGTGKSGNIIDFSIAWDGLSDNRQILELAHHYNILSHSDYETLKDARYNSLDAITARKVIEYAMNWHKEMLYNTSEGQRAAEYLLDRGYKEETIKNNNIGVAPGFKENNIIDYLMEEGFSLKEIGGQDLIKLNEGKHAASPFSYFPSFTDRILFPIKDETGEVLGFGGRIFPWKEEELKEKGIMLPKYKNTAEEGTNGKTLFSKSNLFYGIDRVFKELRQSKHVFLTEGYTDVDLTQQSGVISIGEMGTALTDRQIRKLRYRDNIEEIILLYDGDNAGRKATLKSMNLLANKTDKIVSAILLPKGEDPASYAAKYGGEGFEDLLLANKSSTIDVHLELNKPIDTKEKKILVAKKIAESTRQQPYINQLSMINEFVDKLEIREDEAGEIILQETKRKAISEKDEYIFTKNKFASSAKYYILDALQQNPKVAMSWMENDLPPNEIPEHIMPYKLLDFYQWMYDHLKHNPKMKRPFIILNRNFVQKDQQELFDDKTELVKKDNNNTSINPGIYDFVKIKHVDKDLYNLPPQIINALMRPLPKEYSRYKAFLEAGYNEYLQKENFDKAAQLISEGKVEDFEKVLKYIAGTK